MHKAFFQNLQHDALLFKRFRMLRCLSATQTGGVYLCSDSRSHGKRVVLKVISSDAFQDPVHGSRFLNEIEVGRRVNHPGIVHCMNFFEDKFFAAFSMEYLDGGTLAEFIAEDEERDPDIVVGFLLQICEAIHSVHQAGIVHRDLKPENILLASDGTLKITDFGIAVIGESGVTGEEDALVGTVNYLSPEYIETGIYDHRSDLYSVGLMGYELLIGALPINGSSPLERLTNRVQLEAPALSSLREDVPVFLSTFLMKTLQREPHLRYQSAHQMAEILSEGASLHSAALQIGLTGALDRVLSN